MVMVIRNNVTQSGCITNFFITSTLSRVRNAARKSVSLITRIFAHAMPQLAITVRVLMLMDKNFKLLVKSVGG